MAANYSLPGSLEPPSYGEMARIGALSGEVEQRALAQLRREIGLRNMQSETAAAIAQGQEPLVARRNALLNNARFLFADNPQALVALQHNEEAAQMRDAYQRAMLQQRMLHEQNVQSLNEARVTDWEKRRALEGERNQLLSERDALNAQIKLTGQTADLEKARASIDLGLARLEAQANKLSPAAAESRDYANLQRDLRQTESELAEGPRTDLETGKVYPTDTPALRERQQFIRDQLSNMEARRNVEETTVMTPGGPTVTLRKGGATTKQPGALTISEQSRLGDDVQASANSLRVLNSLQGQLDKGAVGIMPTIGTVLFDEILGQFDKGLVDKNRAMARQNIGLATQQVLGELNNRGRFSNMELEAIKSLMPGLGGRESPERAKIKVANLRRVLAEKGVHAAMTLGRPIPPETLTTLSEIPDKELADEVAKGALEPAAFWAVRDYKYGKR